MMNLLQTVTTLRQISAGVVDFRDKAQIISVNIMMHGELQGEDPHFRLHEVTFYDMVSIPSPLVPESNPSTGNIAGANLACKSLPILAPGP
jgi:hypothetical protein